MKRIILLLVLIYSLIMFSSCSDNNTENPPINTSETELETETESKTEAEEIIFVPQGEKLVYITPDDGRISDNVVNSINLYLQKLGKPYYIEFAALSGEWEDSSVGNNGKYIEALKKRIDTGESVDLLQTGMPWDINGYEDLALNGYLYDLSEYLSSSEGKPLYDSVPQYYWEDAKVKGKIYGANGYTYYRNSCPSYMINKSLMEKYNLKAEDFNRPLHELKDIFEKVQKGEGDGFYPFTAEISPDYSISSAYAVCSGVNIDRSNNTVRILTDNEDYMSFVKDIYEMEAQGFYSSEARSKIDNFLLKFSFKTPLPDYLIGSGAYTFEGRTATADDVVIIPLEKYGNYRVAASGYTSVCSKSKHADYAADFLNTIFTDTNVTDYLLFGVKDIDYELEEGKISQSSFLHDENEKFSAEIFKMLIYGNSFICTPRYYERDDMSKVYYDMHKSLQKDPLNKFRFNAEGYAKTLGEINNSLELITKDIGKKSFEDMKSELEESLRKAGIDKLLQEVNRQLQEYLAS